MLTRPCLISVSRRRVKASTSPSDAKPTGSQKPTGGWTPSSSCETILEEHADDCHHREAAIRNLGRQFVLLLLWISTCQNLEAEVTRSLAAVVHAINLATRTIKNDLRPS